MSARVTVTAPFAYREEKMLPYTVPFAYREETLLPYTVPFAYREETLLPYTVPFAYREDFFYHIPCHLPTAKIFFTIYRAICLSQCWDTVTRYHLKNRGVGKRTIRYRKLRYHIPYRLKNRGTPNRTIFYHFFKALPCRTLQKTDRVVAA